jgi:hypothetical protein
VPSPYLAASGSSGAFVQVSLFLFVLAHAMGKLTTIPLLLKTSLAALPAYLGGAIALYLLYKLARRDFQYWVPTAGACLSLVSRVFGKLYGDFSGNPQFRHPFEIGGAAYLLMLCETQCTLVASTVAYSRLYAGDDKIDDAPLLTALAVLVGTWAVALGTFLLSINLNRTYSTLGSHAKSGPRMHRSPRMAVPVSSKWRFAVGHGRHQPQSLAQR